MGRREHVVTIIGTVYEGLLLVEFHQLVRFNKRPLGKVYIGRMRRITKISLSLASLKFLCVSPKVSSSGSKVGLFMMKKLDYFRFWALYLFFS